MEYYMQSQHFQIFFIKFWKLFLKLQYDGEQLAQAARHLNGAKGDFLDVTQIPLARHVYNRVLTILRERTCQHFTEAAWLKNPYEISTLPEFSVNDDLEENDGDTSIQLVFFDQFCFDFLKLFGVERLLAFTEDTFKDILRSLFRLVTVSVQDQQTGMHEIKIKDVRKFKIVANSEPEDH